MNLDDHKLVQRLFDVVAPLFAGVPGGYTRDHQDGASP